ncbi:hypothetical protein [Metaclostridioides mangenotii]|nr:hypothetical protein [Clostridioides mangenotii]
MKCKEKQIFYHLEVENEIDDVYVGTADLVRKQHSYAVNRS